MNSRHPDPRRMRSGVGGFVIWEANYKGNLRTKLRTKSFLFFKNGNLRFLTHSRDLGAILPPKWSYGRRASFLFQTNTHKTQFGLFFPGCVFWWGVCPRRKGPGPRGPGPIWARGPYRPWPIWAIAHMGYANLLLLPIYYLCQFIIFANLLILSISGIGRPPPGGAYI